MATKSAEKTTPVQKEATRERLLAAALDVFGRYGFDGASTRQLADAAGVNLQAIPYHFGGKQGLYLAAADYLAEMISGHVGAIRQRIAAELAALDAAGAPLSPQQASVFLGEVVEVMVVLFVSKPSEAWARFIIREQMEPTAAFERVYARIMGPMIDMGRRLIGAILGEDPASDNVRLRSLSFMGSLLVFRVANAAVLAQMQWESVGEEQVALLKRHAHNLVVAMVAGRGEPR